MKTLLKESELEHREVRIEIEYLGGSKPRAVVNGAWTKIKIDGKINKLTNNLKIEFHTDGVNVVMRMFVKQDQDINEWLKESGCSKSEIKNEANSLMTVDVTWLNPIITIKKFEKEDFFEKEDGDKNEEKN